MACTAVAPIAGRLKAEEDGEGRLEDGLHNSRVGRKALAGRRAEVSLSALGDGSVSPMAFRMGGLSGLGSPGRVGNVVLLVAYADGRKVAATKTAPSNLDRDAALLGHAVDRDAPLASSEVATSRCAV